MDSKITGCFLLWLELFNFAVEVLHIDAAVVHVIVVVNKVL